MSVRPLPFSEKYFLNTTVLNLISPPNREQVKIEQLGTSVVDSIVNTDVEIFSAKPATSYWHWATKPLRVPVRLAYIIFVSNCIAPLGMVYHGVQATKHLRSYRWTEDKEKEKQKEKQINWDSAVAHVKALFSDFKVALTGALLTATVVCSSLVLLEVLHVTPLMVDLAAMGQVARISLIASAAVLLSIANLIGAAYERTVPAFFGAWDCVPGMALSLSLRNEWGVVNTAGQPVQFSSEDKIDFTPYLVGTLNFPSIEGHVVDSMTSWIRRRDEQLLKVVVELNALLSHVGLEPIQYTYPIDGNFVAWEVEEGIRQGVVTDRVNHFTFLAGQLRQLQTEISSMKSCLRMLIIGSTGGIPDVVASAIDETEYQNYFNAVYHNPVYGVDEISLVGFSGKVPKKIETYDDFKKGLQSRYSAWKSDRQTGSRYWVMGLDETQPVDDLSKELAKRYKKLQLELHPDKNKGRLTEAKELAQILNTINEVLTADVEKRKQIESLRSD